MVDANKAKRRIHVLLDALADLRRYRDSVTKVQLTRERDVQHMVLHAMYVAIQATVDLAMHVAADGGLPQSSSYRAVFRALADASIIDHDLAGRLEGWAGFRNVLAHLYSVIDYDRVYESLSEIDDLERFATTVGSLVDGS